MNSKKTKGDLGEKLAEKQLKKRGHKILEKNYSVHNVGEIDIISRQGEYIVFTEVKTRNENYLFAPRMAVNKQKQGRIIRTAQYYLLSKKIELQPRFDVTEVVLCGDKPIDITIIENAFGV